MDLDTYAPWEHYPKTLSQYEITDPVKVVAEFFGISSVKSHRRKLKEWRELVTSEDFYNNPLHGPGDLLFTYDANLKLIEATHLLWLSYRNESWHFKSANGSQLQLEKKSWDYFPKNLTLKEKQNPYKALKKVFANIQPQAYRDNLHEWLYFGLYNSRADETLPAGDIITVYENLSKLYSLAWIIHRRNVDDLAPVNEKQPVGQNNTIDADTEAASTLRTKTKALTLEELKKLILSRFPEVTLIVHLGTRLGSTLIYLLVLVDDECKTIEHEISNKIEDNCRYLADTLVLVHKRGSALKALQKGSRFWTDVLTNGDKLYESAELPFSERTDAVEDNFVGSASYNWHRWGLQGKEFLTGADFYGEANNYRLAAFLLHQGAESILTAVIQAVYGYRISVHNLSKMLKITLLFTELLYSIFELETEDGRLLFKLLQNAYTESRYKDEFNPRREDVELITRRVNALYSVAEQLCRSVEVEMSSR